MKSFLGCFAAPTFARRLGGILVAGAATFGASPVGGISVGARAIGAEPAPLFQTSDASAPARFNGGAYVSLSAANLFVKREQSRTTPYSQLTLGAWARGTETTTGKVESYFVPGASPAIIEFRFVGQSTNNDGVAKHQKRDVTIHTDSVSSLDVRKPVRIDENGLTELPLEGCVQTTIGVKCVDAEKGIVRMLARRRVHKQQGEAEALKSQQLRQQVGEELQQEIAKQLVPAQKTFQEKVRDMLTAQDAFPRQVLTRTTDQRLELRLLHHGADQLEPPTRPASLPNGLDLAIVLHESLLGNMAESLWGGETVRDEQFLQFLKTTTGRPPRALWVHDREPRWSITLANRLPVTGQFRSDRLNLTLRGQAVTRGSETLQAPFEASASYQYFITMDGPRLVREGAMQFRFTDDAPESAERSDFGRFLERKMEGLFQGELNFDGLTPPTGGAGDKLRQFRLASLDCNHEWITIGYKMLKAESPPSTAVAKP